jgi:hypothetical protein
MDVSNSHLHSFSNWTPRAWLSVSKVSIRFKNECKLTSPFSV